MDNSSNTSTKTTLRFQIEQEIATLLVNKLESQQITPIRASQVARFVLQTIPLQITDEQMMAIIPTLDDEFFELATVVSNHIREYEAKYKPLVELEVRELIKQGHFPEASSLMNQYFQKKYFPV